MEAVIGRYKALLEALLASPAVPFDENLHGALPTEGGVYRIFEEGADWQSSVYVGRTGDLQNRIYGNHLMGNRRASTLKRKLIKYGECADEDAVKRYLKEKCLVQFLIVSDSDERTSFEHFAVAILRPRYNDKRPKRKPTRVQTLKQESQPRSSFISRTLQVQRELASIFYLSMVLLYLFTHLEETGERLDRLPWWAVSLFLLLNFSWTAFWIAIGEKWKSEGKLHYYRANLQGLAIALPYLLAIQYATGLSDRLVELMQGWLPNLSSSAVKWLSRILEWSVSGAIGNAFWEFLKSRWELRKKAQASRRR